MKNSLRIRGVCYQKIVTTAATGQCLLSFYLFDITHVFTISERYTDSGVYVLSKPLSYYTRVSALKVIYKRTLVLRCVFYKIKHTE